VIGESQSHRVIPFARSIGAEYFDPPVIADPAEQLAWNQRWIRTKMDQGYSIIDIGPDPGRPLDPSDFYAMEKSEIARRSYAKHMEWQT
jgi:hypothetical protein